MDNYSEDIDWDKIYGAFHDPKSIADRISHEFANVDICYAVGSTQFSYEARRSFYRKAAIETWFKKTFVGYETTLCGPRLNGDPSFLVKLTKPGSSE